jgi:predicted  nucleic acid-binding Zn-ribbon protein
MLFPTTSRRNRHLSFWLILASASFGTRLVAATTCDKSKPKEACDIIIDPSAPVSGRTFHVRNGTQVTIKVEPKSPFAKCSLAVKERLPIAEENAFQTFLSAITQAGLPIALLARASDARAAATQTAFARAATVKDPEIQKILKEIRKLLDTIETRENTVSEDLGKQYDQVRKLGDRIAELRLNPSRGKTQISDMEGEFKKDRGEIVVEIDALKKSLTPDTSDISDSMKDVAKRINDNAATILAADANLLAQLNQELANARSTLTAINEAITSLGGAKSKLNAQGDFLRTLPVEFSATFHYSDTNCTVKHEVSCTDRQSGEATGMGTVAYTIEFRDLPRATVSLGVLTSMLDMRQIGSVSVKDPSSANGFKKVFGETDRAGLQIIPFSFLNVRLWNWTWNHRDIMLNWSEGFGINPNNGGKDPEFFSGISFGIRDFYVQIGAHHGKWQELGGKFSFDDTVPETLTAPVLWRYTTHFGFGVSYRIPPK